MTGLSKISIPRPFYPPLLLAAFVLVFRDKTIDLINSTLVKPLFSSIRHSTVTIDVTCLLIVAWVTWSFIRRGIAGVRISDLLVAYIAAFTFIFVYFRYAQPPPFIYVHYAISWLSKLAILDVILYAPSAGLLLYYSLYHGKQLFAPPKRGYAAQGFYADEPMVLTKSNDLLGRFGFALDLKERILATKTTKHSFAVGVIGKWGWGKTSFMDTLYQQLSQEKDVIVFKFNPWATGGINNVTSLFFNNLSAILSRFDESLHHEILSYSQDLLQSAHPPAKEFIKALIPIFRKDKDWDERFAEINQSIRDIGKKIVVFIDDVDRLEKREIIEVLRIVRNTANFNNVFFIVAFDKTYVTASINSALVSNSEQYIEKIFQLEYYLPPPSDKNLYTTALFSELKSILDTDGKKRLEEVITAQSGTFNNEIVPDFQSHLRSFRDIKRYLNIFMLNYFYIKNNIYFPDYLAICLLRLKYPEVYQLLYFEKDRYLTEYRIQGTMPVATGSLGLVTMPEGSGRQMLLAQDLEAAADRYAVNKHDVPTAVGLVASIFERSDGGGLITFRRSLSNHHLSIVHLDCFDRYFDLSMEGRLDQKEFDDALNEDLDSLKRRIDNWNRVRSLATDLHLKFENLDIDHISDKPTFEKAIKAITYFANLGPANDAFADINQFSSTNLYQKLAGEDRDRAVNAVKFYQGDLQKFKAFLQSLFYEAVPPGKISFMFDFGVTLLQQYPNRFVLKDEELRGVMKDVFIMKCQTENIEFDDVWPLYTQIIREFADKSVHDYYIKSIGAGIEMTDALRQRIIQRWLEPFLNVLIFYNKPLGYQINFWLETLFQPKESFMQLLNDRRGNPAVDEFIRFSQEVEQNQGLIVNSFDFTHLRPLGAPNG